MRNANKEIDSYDYDFVENESGCIVDTRLEKTQR